MHGVSATPGPRGGSGASRIAACGNQHGRLGIGNRGPQGSALFLKGNFVDQRIETTAAKAAQVGTKTVNLGLQGGGSHGAFTWGVLDRLLEDDRISFEGITASSAGAVNAVVLAHGLTSAAAKRQGIRCGDFGNACRKRLPTACCNLR